MSLLASAITKVFDEEHITVERPKNATRSAPTVAQFSTFVELLAGSENLVAFVNLCWFTTVANLTNQLALGVDGGHDQES